MSMGKSDLPPAPDYAAAARAQGGANLQSTIASNVMNRPNEITPMGRRLWQQTGSYTVPAAEGNTAVTVPTWQSQIKLTPLGQQRFEQEQRITGRLGDVAESGVNRVGQALQNPFNIGAAAHRPDLPDSMGQQPTMPQITQAYFEESTRSVAAGSGVDASLDAD